FRAGKEWYDSSGDADDDGTRRIDISARRCDDDKASNRAGTKSEHTRFAPQRVLEHRPRERRYSRGESRSHKRICGDSVWGERASRIKAVPPHPEQSCPDHAKHHAMRRHYFFSKSQPVAQKYAQNER